MSESFAPGAPPQDIHNAVEAPYRAEAPDWQDLPTADVGTSFAPLHAPERSGARMLGMPVWLVVAPLLLITGAGAYFLGAKTSAAAKAVDVATPAVATAAHTASASAPAPAPAPAANAAEPTRRNPQPPSQRTDP